MWHFIQIHLKIQLVFWCLWILFHGSNTNLNLMIWIHILNFRFCFTCIDNWATITNLCPLCQSEFQLITCVPVSDIKFVKYWICLPHFYANYFTEVIFFTWPISMIFWLFQLKSYLEIIFESICNMVTKAYDLPFWLWRYMTPLEATRLRMSHFLGTFSF